MWNPYTLSILFLVVRLIEIVQPDVEENLHKLFTIKYYIGLIQAVELFVANITQPTCRENKWLQGCPVRGSNQHRKYPIWGTLY